MGLFSAIGKAIGGVAKIAVGGLKLGASLGILPGGGLVGKAAQVLLAKKQPMGTTSGKLVLRDPRLMRGNVTQSGMSSYKTATGYKPPPSVLRLSPVMPGGGIATPRGIMPKVGGTPPAAYAGGGGGGAPTKRRRRRKSSSSSSTRSKRRKRGGTRARFGSKAWRKYYGLDKKKSRRRRAA